MCTGQCDLGNAPVKSPFQVPSGWFQLTAGPKWDNRFMLQEPVFQKAKEGWKKKINKGKKERRKIYNQILKFTHFGEWFWRHFFQKALLTLQQIWCNHLPLETQVKKSTQCWALEGRDRCAVSCFTFFYLLFQLQWSLNYPKRLLFPYFQNFHMLLSLKLATAQPICTNVG